MVHRPARGGRANVRSGGADDALVRKAPWKNPFLLGCNYLYGRQLARD